jgi:hypothetical protein
MTFAILFGMAWTSVVTIIIYREYLILRGEPT